MVDTMNHVATVWWNLSVSMFWQVGLLIVAIACADVLLRRFIWPQIRYALWLMVLVKLILPPGLHSPSSVTSVVQPLAQKLTVPTPVAQQAHERPELYRILTAPTPFLEEADRTLLNASGQDPVVPSLHIVETVAHAPASSSILARLNWRVYVMGLWITVTGTLGLWLVVRLRRLRQGLPSDHNRLCTSFYEQLDACAKSVGLKNVPKVVVTERVIVPAVTGILRPVLLMPPDFLRQLSRKDTRHMLLHELSHIKRGDLWVHGTYMTLQIIHWYNPLLWLANRQMHHLRELCCDASVAGLLKEHTMEYRNTLLDIARRYLSRPTEPSLGLLGLFEDSNRLAVRLNWLKKDTHRFQKTRTLLIVLLVGTMMACVLPMAQADEAVESTPSATTNKPETEDPPSEYAELLKEIEALKQRVIQKDKQAVQAVEVQFVETNAADKKTQALLQQIEALTLQQQAITQQLNQLKASLPHADPPKPEQTGLKQQFQTQLQHLETAKARMKDAQKRIAENEKLHVLVRSMDAMGKQVDQWVDKDGVKVWVKEYAGKLPQEVLPHIQNWTNSKDFQQWQQDMKAWEQDMKAWSKQFAKMAKDRVNNVKPDESSLDVSMPEMPAMPTMPSHSNPRHEQLAPPVPPQPHSSVHPHIRVDAHVVTDGIPVPPEQQIIGTIDELTVTVPDTKAEAMGTVSILTPDGHVQGELVLPAHPQPHPNAHPQVHVESRVAAPKTVRIVKHKAHKGTPHLEQVVEHEVHMDGPNLVRVEEHEIRTVAPQLVGEATTKTKHPAENQARSTKTMTLSFPEAKCQSVKLSNKIGNITVLGTDKDQCSVEVKISAKGQDLDTTRALMDQVRVTTDEKDQVLTITPHAPDNTKDAQVIVEFTLRLPRALNLNLATQVGNVTLRNMKGRIDCQANVGNIQAQATSQGLNANTNVGNILVAVDEDTDATISALCNVGKIQSKQAFTLSPARTTGAKGVLSLGAGKIPVNLKVNVGSIHIGSQSDVDKLETSKVETRTYRVTTSSKN